MGFSGYGFYRSLRPRIVEKIVEKPVDRIVEKLVPQECPEPKAGSKKPQKSMSQDNQGGSNNTNTQIGTAQAPVANAPNGIANAAPNLGTQSVNNFAPPPITFTWVTKDVVPPMDSDKPSKYKFEKVVTVTPSAAYSPVSIAIECDSDLENVSGMPEGGGALFTPVESLAATSKRIAVIYFGGTPITSSNPLIVHLWADQSFSVLRVWQARSKGHSD